MSKLFGARGGGGQQKIYIADFGLLGQKMVPAPAGEIFFSSRIFFLKKNVASLKSSKSGVGGQKAIYEGVVLKARGVIIFFQQGVARVPQPLAHLCPRVFTK